MTDKSGSPDGLTKQEIIDGLHAVGLKQGDVALIHTAMRTFGRIEGGGATVMDAFLEVLGRRGTLVAPAFTFFLQPAFSSISRKHEFEADDFATAQVRPGSLINALVKLYRENANTLTPDPMYSAFHDSHPPAPIRIAHLSAR